MVPLAVVALALLGVGAVAVRRSRATALATLRARWGQPIDRERRLAAIAASHRSRLASFQPGSSLDARTWEDLDLDAVFAALDRTHSTLGQHALYHRLRSSPVAPCLPAFDRLVSRLSDDARLRERAQTALSRLADPHGYDLWWLADPAAIDTRPWYVVFPILTAATLVLFVLALLASQFTAALVAILVVNVVVRYAMDRRTAAIAAAFRQIAPVTTTAASLRFLVADDVRPLIGALEADTPSLGRLRTVARWLSGDPLMLPAGAGSLALLMNDVVSAAYEYLNLALVLDGSAVYIGARDLRAHHGALLRVIAAAGEVDAAISIASFRTERQDWTRSRTP